MKYTRIITAIIAFVATFVLSAGLVRLLFGAPQPVLPVYFNKPQCANRHAASIESFVWQDIRNGETRMDRTSRYSDGKFYSAEFADAVMEYSETSSSMDASRLPQDFQSAWRKHMKAWRDYADFLNEVTNSPERKTNSQESLRESETRFNAEINRTWYEVLRIGRSYGANVN